eukprot:gnl/TRDRNA2_/TRDRNA2_163923_c0_seq2.p2 gnl/TRDRNA2_/TRDRNA2_163923_c0~~gnl/TRDRNA2_/TRDRNA2_163923_c0_seq2.p2  ORF type:complete len:118 (-),score=26.63 gnl/TRDRNA2_/TRDRNA2_163923_c0_seq2:275-628(-)
MIRLVHAVKAALVVALCIGEDAQMQVMVECGNKMTEIPEMQKFIDSPQSMHDNFGMVDSNADGFISIKEMWAFLYNDGLDQKCMVVASSMIARMDQDNDDKIAKSEVKRMISPSGDL